MKNNQIIIRLQLSLHYCASNKGNLVNFQLLQDTYNDHNDLPDHLEDKVDLLGESNVSNSS